MIIFDFFFFPLQLIAFDHLEEEKKELTLLNRRSSMSVYFSNSISPWIKRRENRHLSLLLINF
jgi:hypothetical protein